MDATKKQHLEEQGYTVGDAAEVLDLTPEEEALMETGLALAALVRETREARGLTQKQLAEKLGTKQPNIARIENAVGSSFDAAFRALFIMGASPQEIAQALMGVSFKAQPVPA